MKNYYLINRWMFFYLAVTILPIIVIIGFLIWLSGYANHNSDGIPDCFSVYLAVLGMITVALSLYKAVQEHLAVSENGIEYYSPWSVLEINWGSIEKISYGWHNQLRVEGLLVDTASVRIKKHSLLDRSLPVFYAQKMIIPLSCFSNKWRESELGQQIKQYAPNLFL